MRIPRTLLTQARQKRGREYEKVVRNHMQSQKKKKERKHLKAEGKEEEKGPATQQTLVRWFSVDGLCSHHSPSFILEDFHQEERKFCTQKIVKIGSGQFDQTFHSKRRYLRETKASGREREKEKAKFQKSYPEHIIEILKRSNKFFIYLRRIRMRQNHVRRKYIERKRAKNDRRKVRENAS